MNLIMKVYIYYNNSFGILYNYIDVDMDNLGYGKHMHIAVIYFD